MKKKKEVVKYCLNDLKSKKWKMKFKYFSKVCEFGDLEIVEEIQKHTIFSEKNQKTKHFTKRSPLHWASYYGNPQIVKYLLETSEYDPNELDTYKKNSFDLSVEMKHFQISSILIKSGKLDFTKKGIKGQTSLHLFIIKNRNFKIFKKIFDEVVTYLN